MTAPAIDKNRQVIPRWLDYSTACSLGLLRASGKIINLKDDENHANLIYKWHEKQSVLSAVDLISEAIIIKDFDSIYAHDAANYILTNKPSIYPVQTELAISYLEAKTLRHPEPLVGTKIDARKCISTLRSTLNQYPLDALAWSDLAMCYAGNGSNKKAARAAIVALSLGNNNRFILRNIANCYLQFNEPDRAVYILRHSRLGVFDPWIASAEIAISENAGIKSRLISDGKNLVYDENLSFFSRSELAAQLGTLEFKHGAGTKSKRLMRLALQDPNENSLAQIQWFAKEAHHELYLTKKDVQAPYEAESWRHYFTRKFPECIEATKLWSHFQPLSVQPLLQATFILSTCMNDDITAIRMIESTLPVLLTNVEVKNNYAVSLIEIGEIGKAKDLLNSIDNENLTQIQKLIHLASLGMLAFRTGNLELGEQLYIESIRGFEKRGEPANAANATYCLAREENRVGSPNAISRAKEAKRKIDKHGPFAMKDVADKLVKDMQIIVSE